LLDVKADRHAFDFVITVFQIDRRAVSGLMVLPSVGSKLFPLEKGGYTRGKDHRTRNIRYKRTTKYFLLYKLEKCRTMARNMRFADSLKSMATF
jgi:hypothetical protein